MHVKAGSTIVKLKMPKQVRRPGRYTLVFVAVSGNDTTRTVIPVQIVKSGKGLGKEVHPNAQPVDVVLAGDAIPKGIALGIDDPQTRVIQAADPGVTFAATGSPQKNVQVVVVDADQYGLGFVRDLRTVFPTVKLVAITDDPRKLAAVSVPPGRTKLFSSGSASLNRSQSRSSASTCSCVTRSLPSTSTGTDRSAPTSKRSFCTRWSVSRNASGTSPARTSPTHEFSSSTIP